MDALIALATSEIHELDCAFASLILYDHILCIGEEVRLENNHVVLYSELCPIRFDTSGLDHGRFPDFFIYL